jgi:hypothetical protein
MLFLPAFLPKKCCQCTQAFNNTFNTFLKVKGTGHLSDCLIYRGRQCKGITISNVIKVNIQQEHLFLMDKNVLFEHRKKDRTITTCH